VAIKDVDGEAAGGAPESRPLAAHEARSRGRRLKPYGSLASSNVFRHF
jgi:hypothetical protein